MYVHTTRVLPHDYMNIVNSSSKNFFVVNVTQDIMYNYVEGLKDFFCQCQTQSLKKSLLFLHRVFKYTKNLDGVEVSQSASIPLFTYLTMLKNN